MADDGKIKIYGEFDSATAEKILADVSQIRGAAKSTDINAINTQIQQIEQQIAGGGGGTAEVPELSLDVPFTTTEDRNVISLSEEQQQQVATFMSENNNPPLIRLSIAKDQIKIVMTRFDQTSAPVVIYVADLAQKSQDYAWRIIMQSTVQGGAFEDIVIVKVPYSAGGSGGGGGETEIPELRLDDLTIDINKDYDKMDFTSTQQQTISAFMTEHSDPPVIIFTAGTTSFVMHRYADELLSTISYEANIYGTGNQTDNHIVMTSNGGTWESLEFSRVHSGSLDIPTVEITTSIIYNQFVQLSEDENAQLNAAMANNSPMIRIINNDMFACALTEISFRGGTMYVGKTNALSYGSTLLAPGTEISLISSGSAWYALLLQDANIDYVYSPNDWYFDKLTHTISHNGGSMVADAVGNNAHIDVYPINSKEEKFLDDFLASNIVVWDEENQEIKLQLKDTCEEEDIPSGLKLRIVVTNGYVPAD